MRIGRLVLGLVATLVVLVFADIPAPPAIDQGGVVNGASHMPASLAGGAIARGARFSLSGVRLGPVRPLRGSESEPPISLGAVSVRIAQGDTRVDAGLLLVSEARIEGWIPASAPVGAVQPAAADVDDRQGIGGANVVRALQALIDAKRRRDLSRYGAISNGGK